MSMSQASMMRELEAVFDVPKAMITRGRQQIHNHSRQRSLAKKVVHHAISGLENAELYEKPLTHKDLRRQIKSRIRMELGPVLWLVWSWRIYTWVKYIWERWDSEKVAQQSATW